MSSSTFLALLTATFASSESWGEVGWEERVGGEGEGGRGGEGEERMKREGQEWVSVCYFTLTLYLPFPIFTKSSTVNECCYPL